MTAGMTGSLRRGDANPVVLNDQTDLFLIQLQRYERLAGLCMAGDVGKCLLADPQEGDLDTAIQAWDRRGSFFKENRNAVPGLKLIDVGLQCRFQPVIIQDSGA